MLGYAGTSVGAASMVVAGAFSNQNVSWMMAMYGMMLPSKWVSNELANYLRSRKLIVKRQLSQQRTVREPSSGGNSDAGAAGAVLDAPLLGEDRRDDDSASNVVTVGATHSPEGVRPLLFVATAAVGSFAAYMVIETNAPSPSSGTYCGPVSFADGSIAINYILAEVSVLIAAALALRTALLIPALDGFFPMCTRVARWRCCTRCCCCHFRCCAWKPGASHSDSSMLRPAPVSGAAAETQLTASTSSGCLESRDVDAKAAAPDDAR